MLPGKVSHEPENPRNAKSLIFDLLLKKLIYRTRQYTMGNVKHLEVFIVYINIIFVDIIITCFILLNFYLGNYMLNYMGLDELIQESCIPLDEANKAKARHD